MSVTIFDELLSIVKDRLTKNNYRSLSAEFKLAFIVCYLASGSNPTTLAHYWKIGKSTAYAIIDEVCDVLWDALKNTHVFPPSAADYKKIADGFWTRWNFPNCCRSLDGKHIRIQCPMGSGSQFYNYKNFYSVALMATCDANYSFTWVEVGDYGSLPDSSIFTSCQLGKAMRDGTLNLPEPASLPGTNHEVPFFFIGDEAFPLRNDLMRPYAQRALRGDAQRIFNYRLSRARLTIENAFGILTRRWQVLTTSMGMYPDNVARVVLATVCLHNFIKKREEHVAGFRQYCPPRYADEVDADGNVQPGQWRAQAQQARNFEEVGRAGTNRASSAAIDQRDVMAEYFLSSEGFVEWQWRSALRGFEVNVP